MHVVRLYEMRETRDGTKGDKSSKASSVGSVPLILDLDDFKGNFSFDALFGNLINELLPSFQDDDADSSEANSSVGGQDTMSNGHLRSEMAKSAQAPSSPLFPEVDALQTLLKDSCRELVDLRSQIDERLYNLKREVSIQDSKHRKTLSEVERLLSAEQKATDYKTPDDGNAPDHRPTNACTRVVAYLSRVLDVAFTALEGLNKQAFLTEVGNRLHKGLLNHWQKFTFSASGGLRLKRDITEYGEYVRSFNAPSVDEKFELLGIMANVFIVAPESLSTLFEGTPSIRKDALRFIQLREDFKTAKIASRLNSLVAES